MKNELLDVLSGKSQVRFGATIQAIACYLADGTKPSKEVKNTKHFKKQETERLIHYIDSNKIWFKDLDLSQYISEGAEQQVYLKNSKYVLKLNDSIYYLSWLDYFHNLLLHNYFFSDTAYELLGFTKQKDILYAVLKQAYVKITQKTDLIAVKEFMTANGFNNTRNNDYRNDVLGIILEDLHDENVLTKNGVLYFVDTVFYLTDDFWAL